MSKRLLLISWLLALSFSCSKSKGTTGITLPVLSITFAHDPAIDNANPLATIAHPVPPVLAGAKRYLQYFKIILGGNAGN